PAFYLGSEDNDLEELNRINLNGDTIIWDTNQSGAVGRMNTKGLDLIIERISGELSVLPNGPELVKELKDCYLKSNSIQEATFRFVHYLFKDFGLIVVIPDNQSLKKKMIPVFEDDILQNNPSQIVSKTAARLEENYHAQVNPREINLFYLIDGVRERIIQTDSGFRINNSDIRFTKDEIVKELNLHTERFSPNVVLRGIFQETILPNIAFIGGGSEIAYWLELKDMFQHYGVPYPMLIMRNSFMIIDQKSKEKMDNLGLEIDDLFKDEMELMNELVKKQSHVNLSLDKELEEIRRYYDELREKSGDVDPTLAQHVIAMEVRALKAVEELEKKMLKAERRKFENQQVQIQQLKASLFPSGNLQERVDNILPFYAKYGNDFIRNLYENSPTLEQQFTILTEC
ncbi:MAG: bacillithiol biosynthesis cysteine-adding enzyme BshC, partial [Bacteroidetes bacterium]